VAVFGENGVDYRAIKEFVRSGATLDFEYREYITLRTISPPSTNFFQRIVLFVGNIWYYVLNLFGR